MVAKKATTTTKRINKASAKDNGKTDVLPTAKAKTNTTTVKAVDASRRRRGFGSITSFTRMPILSAAIAEFIGTFLLAAIILATRNEPLWVMFGLLGIVLTVGAISGAHVNPAVTIGAWVTKKISGLRALAYIPAQILGAMLALVVISAYVNAAPPLSDQAAMLGQTNPEVFKAAALPEGKEWGVFFAELLGATIFGFVFAGAYKRRRDITNYALTIGLGFFVVLTVAGAAAVYLGGSAILNPASALALQALSFDVWQIAVYLLAPILGGILGFALHDLLSADGPTADDRAVV